MSQEEVLKKVEKEGVVIMKEILEKLNLGRDSVQRALRKLLEHGEIYMFELKTGAKRKIKRVYYSNRVYLKLNGVKVV